MYSHRNIKKHKNELKKREVYDKKTSSIINNISFILLKVIGISIILIYIISIISGESSKEIIFNLFSFKYKDVFSENYHFNY